MMQNLRVIYILRWREVKRFFRKKARLFGSIGQPLLMIFAFGAWFSWMFESIGQEDYFSFVVAWVVAVNTMMSSFGSWFELIRDKEFWFIKEYLVAPVKRLYLMIWKTLWWATIGMFQGGILLFICSFLGLSLDGLSNILLVLLFMFWIAVLFSAFSMIFASLVPDFQWFQIVNSFLIMPLMMLSGAFYPLWTASSWMQIVAKFNPLAYGVDWIRWAITGESYFSWSTDFLVLGILLVLMLCVWAVCFKRMKVDN